MSEALSSDENLELVDLLRRNLLYQTPRPIFSGEDEQPSHVEMRLVFGHQQRILELINKAGGWVMKTEDRTEILRKHEAASRKAYGDGNDYDLGHLAYGDLVAMRDELTGVDEMQPFRKAIEAELENWGDAIGTGL